MKNKAKTNTTKREFLINKTEKYTGVIYNDHTEYFAKLAKIHNRTVEEVADLVVGSYQSLQMTRIAQALFNKGEFKAGMEVEVTNLPGTRSSTGGPTKAQVKQALTLVESKLGTQKVSGLSEEDYNAKVAKVALGVKQADDEAKALAAKNLKSIEI